MAGSGDDEQQATGRERSGGNQVEGNVVTPAIFNHRTEHRRTTDDPKEKKELGAAYHLTHFIFRCKPGEFRHCLLYTSPSPRDGLLSRMPSSA